MTPHQLLQFLSFLTNRRVTISSLARDNRCTPGAILNTLQGKLHSRKLQTLIKNTLVRELLQYGVRIQKGKDKKVKIIFKSLEV